MCGREPNFELSEEEKQELRKFNWDEFLAITRSAITNKSKFFPEFLIPHATHYITRLWFEPMNRQKARDVVGLGRGGSF